MDELFLKGMFMKRESNTLIDTFCSKHFVKFILIGGFNTLSGTMFSYVYSLAFGVNVAFVLGYITSLLIAYVLNSVWNFKTRMSCRGLVKFCISYIPNFIIQNGVVIVVYNILGWNKLIAYMMAAVIGIPITYVLIRVFAFSKDNKNDTR